MKWVRYPAILAIVLLSLSPAGAAVVAQNDKGVQAVAEPILDAVLAGFNNGNYVLYSKYFDETLKDAMPEKKFQQVSAEVLKKLGKYQSRTYLGYIIQQNSTVALWRGRFKDSNDDVLIKLVLAKRGDKVQVKGLWFQ